MDRPDDLRAWLARIEALGELQHVSGAHWDKEIGAISEINYRRRPSAALLFDDIVGYPSGYRVLTGSVSNARRMAVTLGLVVCGSGHFGAAAHHDARAHHRRGRHFGVLDL